MTRTTEGRILVAGVVLSLGYAAGLLVLLHTNGPLASAVAAMTAAYLVFGRAVGVATGYAGDLGIGTVFAVAFGLGALQVLVFYPLFAFAFTKLFAMGPLQSHFERTRKAAQEHHETIEKYGPIGLGVFVALPITFTGPLVGAAAGCLIGMRPWVVLTSVMAGMFVTLLGWALVLREASEQIQELGPWATWSGLAVVVLVLVTLKIVKKLRKKK